MMAKDHNMSDLRLNRGGYAARLVRTEAELAEAQALRFGCFFGGAGQDEDPFDALCEHVLIQDEGGAVVGTFRVMTLADGGDVPRSYSAARYDLTRLMAFRRPMMELGRFCIRDGVRDAQVLQLAWGMLAALVDRGGVGLLFGCSSFVGTDPAPYRAGFDLLAARHLAPAALAPGLRSSETWDFAHEPGKIDDRRAALAQIPPLLRTYIGMGGWVSDHAVVDRLLGTLHVFTGLEIDAIPPARARALRAIAGVETV